MDKRGGEQRRRLAKELKREAKKREEKNNFLKQQLKIPFSFKENH